MGPKAYDNRMLIALIIAACVLGALFLISWYGFPQAWYGLAIGRARRLAGLSAHSERVDGVRWFHLEGGEGPTLVLLHGFAAEADHWLPVAGLLRFRFRVLAPDLPGFGQSESCEALDCSVPAQAERLWRWLDARGVSDCLLAGNSMGGWVAAQCAALRPDRVHALWLQDPLGVSTAAQSALMEQVTGGGRNPFRIDSPGDYQRLAYEMIARKAPLPYPVLRVGFERTRGLAPHLDRMLGDILERSTPIEALAPTLTMPVLVQWGEKDRAVDVSGAGVLGRSLPDVEVVTHKRIGHLPMLEKPAGSAKLFFDFCRARGLLDSTPVSKD